MPKCTFITKIEKAESDCPIIQVAKDDTPVPYLNPKDMDMAEKVDVSFETETIKARKFKVGIGGSDVYIGLCREAQDAIGVWLESFENLQESYYDLHKKYIQEQKKFRHDLDWFKDSLLNLNDRFWRMNNKLRFYRNMNFWERLRFLFKIW